MIGKCLANFFLFFSLFPWLSFGFLSTDTQPYFIILSMALVFYFGAFNKKILPLAIIPIGASVVAVYYGVFDFFTGRALLGYSSVFFTCAAYYLTRKHYVKDIKKWIYFANIVWLSVGCVQSLINKNVFDFLVAVRTTPDRGVTGLSPEPTYYGIFLLFISWIILNINNYNLRQRYVLLLLLLNVLAIVFLAKSTMVLLILFYLLCFYAFSSLFKSYVNILYLLLLSLISLLVFVNSDLIFDGSRMGGVINQIKDSPFDVIYDDASINQRARDLVYPILGALDNFFLPNGFHSYAEYSNMLDAKLNHFFWWGGGQNVIMSASGSILYELGFISIVFFVFSFFCFCRKKSLTGFFEYFAFSGILFLAIPISFPLIYILMLEKRFSREFPKRKMLVYNNHTKSQI
ncbi:MULTISPECIES: hypothetical protein [unclassified Endozoicomonas]|uniref:hypothetical protein n=1 Tax=unclassified Endozoicomonas TaxID=2644528 RepID=UPI003BB7336E